MEQLPSQVQYRDIIGYPGYRVGDDGSVWSSFDIKPWKRTPGGRWRRLRPNITAKGYRRVNLCRDGQRPKTVMVHTLVLRAFVGPRPLGFEARHLQGAAAGDKLSNLAWGTQEENRNDNHRFGVYARGGEHTQAKLTEAKVLDIRRRRARGEHLASLAAAFGVHMGTIHAIVHRRTWKHLP